jgi:hypothetical protein
MGYSARAAVSAYLPTGTTATNEQIDAAILWADGRIDAYMGGSGYFGATPSELSFYENGLGTSRLLITKTQKPLLTLDSIEVDGEELTDISAIEYLDDIHALFRTDGATFVRGRYNIKIFGDFGFSAVPTDVADASAKLAAGMLTAGTSGDYMAGIGGGAVSSVKIDDTIVKFGDGTGYSSVSSFTGDPYVDAILAQYKGRYISAALI